MSQANVYAGLVGVLAVEAQRHNLPPGQAHALARELWYAAAGLEPVAESKKPVPLIALDSAALERLRGMLSDRFTARTAALLPEERAASGGSATPIPSAQAPLFGELLSEVTSRLHALEDKPEETADSTLRALWQVAAGNPMSVERAAENALPELDAGAMARLRELLARRLDGIPLAHLTGWQRFMGIELLAGPEALVPRKETELLGCAARAILQQLAADRPSVRVIDVCTGAGNLALSLAYHESRARVYGSDLSVEAVGLARRNAGHLGLGERVEFRQGDFLAPFADGQFDRNIDLLVCNPPYISSGKVGTMPSEIIGHEPSLAFDGGPFGVKILQRLLGEAPQYVRPGGWLAFEVGLGQGPALMDRLRRNPSYLDVAAAVDSAGAVRSLVAQVK